MPTVVELPVTRPRTPIVAPGMGSTLPDGAVAKLASQWISAFDFDQKAAETRLQAFLFGSTGVCGGTPKSQMKWASRVLKALGPTHLFDALVQGKRAHFWAVFDYISIGASFYDEDADKKAWIHVQRICIGKGGPSARLNADTSSPASFTKHAIIRLIQRANVHNAEELQITLQTLWPRVAAAEMATRTRREMTLGEQWFVPTGVMIEGAPLIAVMRGPAAGEPGNTCYVITFLLWPMIDEDIKAPLLELDSFLRRHGLLEFSSFKPTYQRLFETVRGQ